MSFFLVENKKRFDKTIKYEMVLPDDDSFHDLDLGADLTEAIAKAEGTN